MTPEARRQRARIAILSRYSRSAPDTTAATAAAEARFAKQVRQEAAAAGEALTDAEVARRAAYRRELFYTRLAYKSAKARSERAAQRRPWSQIESPTPGEMRVELDAGETNSDASPTG